MKLKILLLIIFISLQNTLYAQECRKPIFGDETKIARELCRDVLKSSICKNVPRKDLKNCNQSSALTMSWDMIAGCAEGTLDSMESILEFFKQIMIWIGETVTLQTDWGKISDNSKAVVDSSSLYLKNEYLKHYQSSTDPFREEEALLKMGESIAKLIVDASQKFLEEKSTVFKNCLNTKAQSNVTCEFISNLFLPPAAAVSLLKYGPKSIKQFKGLTQSAIRAEQMVPDVPLEFKVRPRDVINRKTLDEGFLHFSPTNPAQNDQWIKLAKNGKASTFVEIENSALKRLNDQLGDKNLVTSLTNYHKDLLFEAMELFTKKYPDLEMLKYSDFKSSRFAFSKELTPKQLEELNSLLKTVNLKFAEDIKKLNLGPKIQSENLAGWFSSGIGKTADQAGLASRESRKYARAEGLDPTPTVAFDQIKKELGEHANKMETTRINLVREISTKPGGAKILEPIPGTNQLGLNREAFEALRKGDDEAIKIFKEKYGITFSPTERQMLIDYYHGVDKLAPGIWIKERVVANLDDASVGGFSADFAGMGAANIHQVSVDLAKSKGPVDNLIKSIREGEEIVTREFELKKGGFQSQVDETMKRLGQDVDLKCSGDDCVSLVRKSLNVSKKKEIVSDLMRKLGPSSMRLSFIPPGVPKALRTKIAVAGEGIEKELRKRLTKIDGTGIDPAKMKDVMLAIDMPKGVKGDQVNLVLGMKTKETLTQKEIELVQRHFNQVMKDFSGKIDYGDGIIPNYQSGQLVVVRN